MQHALDYRHNYAGNPGYARNPLTGGQMLMIGAGALAVGGLAFWGFQSMKKKKQDSAAAAPDAASNPGLRAHHYYPRAA
jgi:uncharacterized membrane protein YebE (DUF533 family)